MTTNNPHRPLMGVPAEVLIEMYRRTLRKMGIGDEAIEQQLRAIGGEECEMSSRMCKPVEGSSRPK